MFLAVFFITLYVAVFFFMKSLGFDLGVWSGGTVIAEHPWIFLSIYTVVISHLSISAMSLSFHRFHTHKGVILHPVVDYSMQIWLWLVTSLNRLDWAAVHLYHHAHSDQEKDPHSPVHNGIWHALFLGVFDYTKAKSNPEVVRIRNGMKANAFEKFMFKNSFTGPLLLSIVLIAVFGPVWGAVLAVINFLVSPIFAIGGVNAFAHWIGYKNHVTTDNSRNLGFLFPLNFIICGELDHNNHHAHQTSCSFRHRWFEFDIGYTYIKIMNYLGLAKLRSVYNPESLKQELRKQMAILLEKDARFKKRFELLAKEFNTNYNELKNKVERYLAGEKVKLDAAVHELLNEMKRTAMANRKLQLTY
jgi:stearoyl-CoA desaturase (delta-9 desaturase)